jgi:hypothetical protein
MSVENMSMDVSTVAIRPALLVETHRMRKIGMTKVATARNTPRSLAIAFIRVWE